MDFFPLHSLFQALLQGPISYLQQWLTKQWHKQHGLHGPSTPHKSPSVSWPASPAKRDRMHLTHLSASSQVVIRACQPQAAWALKKQMLLIHIWQFCCVFLPPCQSLPSCGQPLLLLTAPASNFSPAYISDPGVRSIFFKLLCIFKSCLLLSLFWRLILLIWEGKLHGHCKESIPIEGFSVASPR